MGGSRALVLFGAVVLAACSDAPPITVEDGSLRQYVSTIREQREPIVKIVVLDDRNTEALAPFVSPYNDRLERDLVALATGFELDNSRPPDEDYPREVALVLVFPASGRIAAAPEVPALHVRSPAFWASDAKAMAGAIREQLDSASSAPRLARYAPIDMARDVGALLTGKRAPRTSQEARIAADVAGVRTHNDAIVVTAPFEGMQTAIPRNDHTIDLLLLGSCPIDLSDRCREAHIASSLFRPSGSHHSSIPIPDWAVRADGSASCIVEVSGEGLGCESRGWTRLATPNGRTRERCAVPQLEGAAKKACPEAARLDTCGAGFYVTAFGPYLGFTKRAYPHQIDAEIRVVCTH